MPFKPDKDARINLTGIETALYNYLYEIVFGIIKKYVKGNAQKELMDFFNDYIDLNNLVRIVRMRKFYDLSSKYIFSGLTKYGSFSDYQLKAFINSPSDKQMMSDMKNTKLGRKWFSKGLDIIDKVPINMRYNWCKHNIRFSISPPIVLMSYIPVEDRLKIGEMVKYYRTQQNLTQKELAKKSKKHISTIQRIESPIAVRGVDRNTVIDIAIALKIPLSRVWKNEYPGYKFIL